MQAQKPGFIGFSGANKKTPMIIRSSAFFVQRLMHHGR